MHFDLTASRSYLAFSAPSQARFAFVRAERGIPLEQGPQEAGRCYPGAGCCDGNPVAIDPVRGGKDGAKSRAAIPGMPLCTCTVHCSPEGVELPYRESAVKPPT